MTNTSFNPGHRYRTPGLPQGYFSRPGNLHMHIDGAHEAHLVDAILQDMAREGVPGKMNVVTNAVAGPQREDLAETYASHTPGGAFERFEYFSTIGLRNRDAAVQALRHVLPRVMSCSGIVIEVEFVIARIDDGVWRMLDVAKWIQPIDSTEVNADRSFTYACELHHAIETTREAPPLDLNELMQRCVEMGLNLGGWFNFQKDRAWAYRSNAFASRDDFQEQAQANHELLDRFLKTTKLDYRLWTLVELVTGVWHTSGTRSES